MAYVFPLHHCSALFPQTSTHLHKHPISEDLDDRSIIQHLKFKLMTAGSIKFYGSINLSEINDLSEILQNPEMLAVYLAAQQQQL